MEDYRLKPYDELYIQITSLDDASSNMFSGAAQQQFTNAGSLQPYGASLVSYGIDKDGFLILPMIGTVNVKDQTILQVSKLLKDSLVSILNQPIVSVKLVNRYISVLGRLEVLAILPWPRKNLPFMMLWAWLEILTNMGTKKRSS
ncbi:MAG: polysaccharide biosynthesis/export family protein [Bacteroidales bacterium]|nr:polysaccharide biosynthesis/export family protein [Bacteroidales bacterium]